MFVRKRSLDKAEKRGKLQAARAEMNFSMYLQSDRHLRIAESAIRYHEEKQGRQAIEIQRLTDKIVRQKDDIKRKAMTIRELHYHIKALEKENDKATSNAAQLRRDILDVVEPNGY